MSELEFNEIEYKYDASSIKLLAFTNLMASLIEKYKGKVEILTKKVSSWDIYFTKEEDAFLRYRQSEINPELSGKQKVHGKNNFQRIEVNLKLNPNISQHEQEKEVEAFCNMLGFKENFRIHKTCFIYYFGPINYVYYIVYDTSMKELRRFIEVEFSEDEAKYHNLDYVFERLDEFEADLESLGITSRNRLKKSLFEMYRQAG